MPKSQTAHAFRLLNDLSDSQIAGLMKAKRLEERRQQLLAESMRLRREADRTAGEADAIERKIRKLLRGSGPAKRARRGESLGDFILKVLGRARTAMGLTEITKAVLKAGYQTQSAMGNFRTTVAHTLRRMRAELGRKGGAYTVKIRKKTSSRRASTQHKGPRKSKARTAPKTELEPAGAPS